MSSSGSGLEGRLARLRKRRAWSGLLSVEESAALSTVGFQQVSEVMGAAVYAVTGVGFYPAGAQPFPYFGRSSAQRHGSIDRNALPTYTSSRASVAVGSPPMISALKSGYRLALDRLVAEARAVGADGVVGVRVTTTRSHWRGGRLLNFLAVGTAVRSMGRTRAGTPFTTALSAAQTASALRAGWVPICYLACPVMAIRGLDQGSRRQRRISAGNGEIRAHTEAVNTCRHQARTDFAAAARSVHADGAVMAEMTLRLGPEKNLVEVTAVITGTALARFATRKELAPISVIAYRDAR
jgi:uncharacterized protein YbjQ (UPF0145 family)